MTSSSPTAMTNLNESRYSSKTTSRLRVFSPILVSQHEEMNPQRRSSMEDCIVYAKPGTWEAPNDDMAFVGLYDGHGGRDMVEYLEHGLIFHVAQELKAKEEEAVNNKDEDTVTVCDCLEQAFLMADIHSRQLGITTSGATVAVCLIQNSKINDNVTLYCANAGDARIVLGYNGQASRLSKDHKPNDPSEIARIEKTGGFLFKGRVLGVLAITRSLGDHSLKSYVTAEPYLSKTEVHLNFHNKDGNDGNPSQPPFVICACDGLWDVFQDQEAVDFVLRYYPQEKERIAEHLVNEALRKGSTDNVSVLVAWL